MPWCNELPGKIGVCCCELTDPGGVMRKLLREDMPVSFQETASRNPGVRWESRYLTCEIAKDSAKMIERARYRQLQLRELSGTLQQMGENFQLQFVRMVELGTKDEDVKIAYFVTRHAVESRLDVPLDKSVA